jgi:hypothetical protein
MGRGVGNYIVVSCSFGGGRETIRHIERSWRSNWLWVSFWGALLVHNYYNNANNNNSPTTTKREARGVL